MTFKVHKWYQLKSYYCEHVYKMKMLQGARTELLLSAGKLHYLSVQWQQQQKEKKLENVYKTTITGSKDA